MHNTISKYTLQKKNLLCEAYDKKNNIIITFHVQVVKKLFMHDVGRTCPWRPKFTGSGSTSFRTPWNYTCSILHGFKFINWQVTYLREAGTTI